MASLTSFGHQLGYVLAGYADACRQPLTGHPMAGVIRRDLPETIQRILTAENLDADLAVQGSPGQGRWARIPWLAVLHRKETTSAMRGVYIVYLFAADMSAIYLTLNQGVTESTTENLRSVCETVLRNVGSIAGYEPGPFPAGTLIIPGRGGHSHGYEEGCIFHKKYDSGRMPTDDELARDLVTLTRAYADYVEGRAPDPAVTVGADNDSPGSAPLETPAVAPPSEPAGVLPSSAPLTTDDLKRRLLERVRQLSPGAFERLLGELWRNMGYRNVRVTGTSHDGGVDGEFDVHLVDVKVAFQAKRYGEGNQVGPRLVRELKGKVGGKYDRGIFVTTSSYTAGAREEVDEPGPRVVLIDGDGLVQMLLDARLGIRSVVERADVDEDVFAGLEG